MGEVKGYMPGIGGPEEGDGNGTKGYELMGITEGGDCVRVPLETGGDGVLVLDVDELRGLEVGMGGVREGE